MRGLGVISIWMQTPVDAADVRRVLVTHEDTYKRLLSDGWQVIQEPPDGATPDVAATAPEILQAEELSPPQPAARHTAQSAMRKVRTHGG